MRVAVSWSSLARTGPSMVVNAAVPGYPNLLLVAYFFLLRDRLVEWEGQGAI